jgi:5-methylcytosine-specific restriction protein A
MPFRPDQRSEEATRYREWYKTPEWHRIRGKRLKEEPICRVCARQKAFDPTFQIDSTLRLIVDHIVPHRGDWRLFSDYGNTQTLCSHHHNSTKQSMEKSGQRTVAIGDDGWPIGDRD